MSIADPTRQAVRERASYLCEYCHSPERLSANRFIIRVLGNYGLKLVCIPRWAIAS